MGIEEFEDTLIHGDCLEEMKFIPDKSINLILCDLPYGTTSAPWDSVIPFDKLWAQYERIIMDNGAIVLTASQPFTSLLVSSNIKLFRHEWIWKKSIAANFGAVKFGPAKHHESVLVFGKKAVSYYPIMQSGKPYTDKARSRGNKLNEKSLDIKSPIVNDGTRYPSSILDIPNPNNKNIHPTQKPLALFEYLIKTYTNEGDIILDNCAGSMTAAVAAINTNRRYICMEKDTTNYELGLKRVDEHLEKLEKETV